MTSGECLMYGLDFEAQSMVAVTADEENIRFLVGTRNIKMDNQVCVLTVKADDVLISSQAYPHPIGEVSSLASSPKEADLLLTSSSDYRSLQARHSLNIYRLNHDRLALDEITNQALETPVNGLEWNISTDEIACFCNTNLSIFSFTDTTLMKLASMQQNGKIRATRWNPHSNGRLVGLCVEKDVSCVDIRSQSVATQIPEAHMFRSLTLDFNPNLPNNLASAGDDGVTRIWDTRQTKVPVHCFKAHSHWTTSLRYHPDHDQLILSGGSDSCVVLTCAQSVSSEVKLTKDDDDAAAEQLPDGELDRIIEHEDTVCSVQWSTTEPWTYASLSYDGRVVVNRVSREHKYILMQL